MKFYVSVMTRKKYLTNDVEHAEKHLERHIRLIKLFFPIRERKFYCLPVPCTLTGKCHLLSQIPPALRIETFRLRRVLPFESTPPPKTDDKKEQSENTMIRTPKNKCWKMPWEYRLPGLCKKSNVLVRFAAVRLFDNGDLRPVNIATGQSL